MTPTKKPTPAPPYLRCDYDVPVVAAVQALSKAAAAVSSSIISASA